MPGLQFPSVVIELFPVPVGRFDSIHPDYIDIESAVRESLPQGDPLLGVIEAQFLEIGFEDNVFVRDLVDILVSAKNFHLLFREFGFAHACSPFLDRRREKTPSIDLST